MDNLSNLNPSSCILSNAKKLTNVEIHSSNLYNIDVTNNTFLRSINLRNCSKLGTVTATGSSLNLSKCKYLKFCDVYNTALTEVQLNSSGGSLTEIYYPKTIQSIQLIKQRLLEVIGLPYSSNLSEIPTSLYTINIQECPSIKKLNVSTDPEIAKSFKAMVYCNNLTIRNSLDLTVLKFDGFYRLRNVVIENMYNLEQIGFNNLLPVGDVSTIKYIGMSNCPKLKEIQLNCTSNNYEITFADNSILNFGKLSSLRSITSNCVLKGLKTIVIPTGLESMFFTNEYGSGYSTIENIWVSSVCDVNTDGTSPVVTHVDNTYRGIDFAGMNLKNIDLGALVNIPRAINFSLSPTTVNPHFNLNRDGSTYPYLKPEGTLNLSNYTESLARFFDGVDLDRLQIICNNNLPQTDLSYCFYNSSFSNNISINKLLSKVSSITNLDYCFYRTTVNSVDILNNINMGTSSTMNYTFAECPNITSLVNVTIPSSVIAVSSMFSGCPLTSITNITVNVNGSISGLFEGCSKLTTINTLRIPNVTDVSNTFNGCTNLTNLTGFELPNTCTNVSNLFNGCYNLIELTINLGNNITSGENWYPPNLEVLNDSNISNDYTKLENCSTLKTINNLVLNVSTVENFLDGTTGLKNINGFTIAGTLTSVARLFKNKALVTANRLIFGNTISDFTSCFENCQGITDSSNITIPNAGTKTMNFSRMFYGCLGITKVFNTIYPSNNSNLTSMYQNCTNLISLSNLTINSSVLNSIFSGCTSLNSVSQLIINNATSLQEMFYGCTSCATISFIIPNTCTNIIGLFQGCTSLSDISGMTFGSGIITSTNWNYGCPITTANNVTVKTPLKLFKGNLTIKYITGLIISGVTDLSNYFEGCTSLLEDIIFTSNIINVSNCFKGCTAMTHIHSNWNNTYTNTITSTDCYSGCTAITHCDNVNLITNEYSVGLDEVPTAWGGYEFNKLHTTVFKLDLNLTSNLTITLNTNKDSDLNITSWGDGVVNNSRTHTYSSLGIYVIKTKTLLGSGNENFLSSSCKNSLTHIIQTGTKNNGFWNRFSGMTNLVSADLSSIDILGTLGNAFENCTSLTTVKFKDTTTIWNANSTFNNCKKLTNVIGFNNVVIQGNLVSSMFGNCSSLTSLNVSSWDTSLVRDMGSMFSGCSSLTSIIGIENLNVSSVTSTSSMFNGCILFTSLNLNSWNTSNVTNMSYMFSGCKNLTSLSISSWDVFLVNNLLGIFNGCSSLTTLNLSYWNTPLASNMGSMFSGCSSLTSIIGIENFNTSKVTNMDSMFYNCSSLTNIDFFKNFNLSSLTTFQNTFRSCTGLTSIDFSNFNLPKLTSFSNTFNGCSNVVSINISNMTTPLLTSTIAMFGGCLKLINIIGLNTLNTSLVSTMESMFNGCSSITSLDFTNCNMSNVTSIHSITMNCSNLTTLIIPMNLCSKLTKWERVFQGTYSIQTLNCLNLNVLGQLIPWLYLAPYDGASSFKYQINIGWYGTLTSDNSSKLTESLTYGSNLSSGFLAKISIQSWENLFRNNLTDYSGTSTIATLTIGATNLAKLTSEQVKIATDKGWTVV